MTVVALSPGRERCGERGCSEEAAVRILVGILALYLCTEHADALEHALSEAAGAWR